MTHYPVIDIKEGTAFAGTHIAQACLILVTAMSNRISIVVVSGSRERLQMAA